MKSGEKMDVRFDLGDWIINNKYFITEGINEYEVYNYETDREEKIKLYSDKSFEECLSWVWINI